MVILNPFSILQEKCGGTALHGLKLCVCERFTDVALQGRPVVFGS